MSGIGFEIIEPVTKGEFCFYRLEAYAFVSICGTPGDCIPRI
jgi:hypothetical protein